MKSFFSFILALVFLANTPLFAADLTHYADPFVGTGKAGNTFPGALVPWGMVSVSPHNDLKAPSGYKHGAPYIYGFGQTHLSGADCPALGGVLVMSTVGAIQPQLEKWRSEYDGETASPGSYSVHLKTWNIQAQLTASTRVGVIRFVFPVSKDSANILLDLGHRLTDEPATVQGFESHVEIEENGDIEGSTQNGDFCSSYAGNKETIYFVARFSKKPVALGTWKDGKQGNDTEQSGSNIGAFARFSTANIEPVMVKIGVSYVSVANAKLNLEAEVKGWDFEGTRAAAKKNWQEEFSRISVSGGSEDELKKFYTALYHVMINPSVFSDINGEYQGMNHTGVKTSTDYVRYSGFSLWNTYRNVHPLLALFYPERELDMVKSLTEISKEGGWSPRFELAGNETQTMVGVPAAAVIADTYLQGLTDFDIESAYEVLAKSLDPKDNRLYGGLKSLLKYGYIPRNDDSKDRIWGSVSTTLQYSYDFWCLAQLAKTLKKDESYQKYIHLSGLYRNLYDPSVGFLRAKNRDGSWVSPFDPLSTEGDQMWKGSGGTGFVEGNAWQYLFDTPQDIDGLQMLLGGDSLFVDKLQECFDKGHYDPTNEPDLTWAYLFDSVPKEAWRTQKEVRQIMDKDYGLGVDGLPGNDDGGTLSAWYVWSALGFYPVCPGSDRYFIGSPIFRSVEIHTNKSFYPGGLLTLKTNNNSARNPYVHSILNNGVEYKKTFLKHEDLVGGGTIVFQMDDQPQK